MRFFTTLFIFSISLSQLLFAQDSTKSILPIDGDRFAAFSFTPFQNSSSSNGEIRKYKNQGFIAFAFGAEIPSTNKDVSYPIPNIKTTTSTTRTNVWFSVASNNRKYVSNNFEAFYGLRHSIHFTRLKESSSVKLEEDLNYISNLSDSIVTLNNKNDFHELTTKTGSWGYQLSPQLGFNYYISKNFSIGGNIILGGLAYQRSFGKKTEEEITHTINSAQSLQKENKDKGYSQSLNMVFTTFSSISISFQF